MKSIDRFPTALVFSAFTATCFFVGNLVRFQGIWWLAAAPVVGGLLGFLCSASVLRAQKLPLWTTWGDQKMATGANNGRKKSSGNASER